MAEVRPFHGWRYAVNEPAERLISPPYDVISPPELARLRGRSPHNVVHLELPEGVEDLGTPDNRYHRAAALFRDWRQASVLTWEAAPALYLYAQEFTLPGRGPLRRLGVLGALGLEPYDRNVVLPHEQTFPKHKEDRYRLLSAAGAQFSPIMGIYSEPDPAARARLEEAAAGPPAMSAIDDEGVRHSLWVCADPDPIRAFAGMLASRQVFIADGHHRYETALRYQAERRGARPPGTDTREADQWYDFVLTYLVAMEDPGLALMPTHRLVRGLPGPSTAILDALREQFSLSPCDDEERAVPGGRLRLLTGEGCVELAVRGENPLAALEPARTAAWRDLEAVVLHRLILDRLLGATAGMEVVYTRDAAEARRRVADGEYPAAFLLPAPRVEQLRAIAAAGERMPEKTTFFWPKAYAGLVVYGDGVVE